jgi:diguanylate cyclase (GGDEF)-like protein/PAS domain S-box-containing protein
MQILKSLKVKIKLKLKKIIKMIKVLFLVKKDFIEIIDSECKNSKDFEITLIDEPLNSLTLLKNSNYEDFDLLIIDINFKKCDYKIYLENLRKINKYIPLIVVSQYNLTNIEYKIYNISESIKNGFDIKKIKETILKLQPKILEYKTNEIKYLRHNENSIKTQNEELQKINLNLNLLLDPFKEFSFYSETDLNGVIIEISKSFSELIGYKKEELVGKKHSIIKHPLEDKKKYKELWEKITKGDIWTGELRCLDKFGNDIWYKTIIFPKRNEFNDIVGYVSIRQDITDKKRLEKLSIIDELTGLYNRRHYNETIKNEKNRAKRINKNIILIMLDVDNLKTYNDSFGHLSGDRLLKSISNVLMLFTKRTNDFAFRLGGDEFAIITSNLTKNDVLNYVDKIKNKIINIKLANEVKITISMGVFIFNPKMEYSCEDIYKFADIALYKAKNSGKNKTIIYEENVT